MQIGCVKWVRDFVVGMVGVGVELEDGIVQVSKLDQIHLIAFSATWTQYLIV